MSSPQVRLKKSAVSGKAPLLDDLSLGELAINYYDGSLYTKQDTGGVGIATTITNLTPWQETYGGGSLSYTGDVLVEGDMRVTGILSVGQGTITLDPANDTVKIGASQFKRQINGNLKLTDTNDNLLKIEVDEVVTAGPGITTSNSTNKVGIDSFQASTYQSAIYNVQAVRGVDVDLTTISLMHNGSQTYQTEYATIRTGGQIATYSSEYESGVIQIYAHPVSSTSTTFRVDRTLIGTGAAGITSTSTTSTSQTAIDTFAKATYKSVMYEVQITRGVSVHTTQLHLVHNGTTASMNEFSVLKTGPSLASFDADISGDNVRLVATPSNSSTTVFDVRRTFHEQ